MDPIASPIWPVNDTTSQPDKQQTDETNPHKQNEQVNGEKENMDKANVNVLPDPVKKDKLWLPHTKKKKQKHIPSSYKESTNPEQHTDIPSGHTIPDIPVKRFINHNGATVSNEGGNEFYQEHFKGRVF